MTSWLHGERLEAVLAAVRAERAQSVLDLGCGDGDLLVPLAAEPGIARLLGLDVSAVALDRARARLAHSGVPEGRVELRRASATEAGAAPAGFDCAVMVEVLEHLDPARLSQLERAVFAKARPRAVIVTTPNAEFNRLLGVPPDRFRHPDHRFEWTRAQFRGWAGRVATAAGYSLACSNIAGGHPDLGGASQMAVFRRSAAETA
jgi:3' terminal RNA ribose 2'-O-methyltransferase Hen1